MKAINQAFNELNKEVIRYRNIYYYEVSKNIYCILKRSRDDISKIKQEFKYQYYLIENKLYKSFGSNTFKLWSLKSTKDYGFTKYKKSNRFIVQTLF